MSAAVPERLDDLERKLRALAREVEEVRALAQRESPPRPTLVERPPIPPPPPRRPREYVPIPPPAPRPPRVEIDYAKLLSAPALALAGGVVTLLGIVFLFVLAVERGWIGPEVRVAFGGAASVVLVLAAMVLHRRFGQLHSALAAAGAGIAGAYATLLAATALYDLIPSTAALGLAAAIAACGVALALRWSSQLLAGIGLIGAILVPLAEALDGGLTTVGTAFAAVVTGAAILVAVARSWPRLAAFAAVAGGVQGAALVLVERSPQPGVVVTAAAFGAVFLAGGIGWHLRHPRLALGGLPTALLLASGAFVFYSALLLFDGSAAGIALIAAALVYAAASAWLFRVRAFRDLSTLLLGVALATGAVGLAGVLSGASLTYVWAAEAVVLFWLARRAREIRFQVAGLAYLVLAIVQALTNEARPEVPLHDHAGARGGDPERRGTRGRARGERVLGTPMARQPHRRARPLPPVRTGAPRPARAPERPPSGPDVERRPLRPVRARHRHRRRVRGIRRVVRRRPRGRQRRLGTHRRGAALRRAASWPQVARACRAGVARRDDGQGAPVRRDAPGHGPTLGLVPRRRSFAAPCGSAARALCRRSGDHHGEPRARPGRNSAPCSRGARAARRCSSWPPSMREPLPGSCGSGATTRPCCGRFSLAVAAAAAPVLVPASGSSRSTPPQPPGSHGSASPSASGGYSWPRSRTSAGHW